MEKLAIGFWLVTGCACAFGMSTHAHRRKRPEFRWFLAGILFGVLALPVYFLIAWKADREDDRALAGLEASPFPDIAPAAEPPRYTVAADAFLMPGWAPRAADEIGKVNPSQAADTQRDPVA